jgi:hypothetical protein
MTREETMPSFPFLLAIGRYAADFSHCRRNPPPRSLMAELRQRMLVSRHRPAIWRSLRSPISLDSRAFMECQPGPLVRAEVHRPHCSSRGLQ